MKYSEFIKLLKESSEKAFAVFQKRLIFTEREILGVRTPTMRKIAKDCLNDVNDLLSFPDEYYETVFIKLTAVSLLPYVQFIQKLPYCISLMDNWALCDTFKAKCIAKNKDVFLSNLKDIFNLNTEFSQRYVLVILLAEYVEEKYRAVLEEYIFNANTDFYYVRMASAWLTAEILIKDYEFGLRIIQDEKLSVKTRNKAIQKAVESYRLTKRQKEHLRSLKIKR